MIGMLFPKPCPGDLVSNSHISGIWRFILWEVICVGWSHEDGMCKLEGLHCLTV